jgi:peptidoglycan/LPS O-acetylase OafA/YrhL
MAQLTTAAGKPHIQQVDYIRAIASLAVALFHLGGKVLPVLKYGWLGVDMFFLLSGFIICWAIPISYTWKLSWRFISKRIIRIEPPYIISIALALTAHFIIKGSYRPDWVNVLSHLAYLNNFTGGQYLNPVYWTLGIEFQFYLFVALCFPFLVSKFGPYFLLALCISSQFIPTPGGSLLAFFPAFALGILYYLYVKKNINIKGFIIFGVLITVWSFYRSGWMPTGACLFALLLLLLPLKANRIVSFFSRISFSLYLTHDIVGSNLVVYLGTLLPKTFWYKGLEFGTGIMVSILFAYLFYLCIEAPFLRLSKRITYPKQLIV